MRKNARLKTFDNEFIDIFNDAITKQSIDRYIKNNWDVITKKVGINKDWVFIIENIPDSLTKIYLCDRFPSPRKYIAIDLIALNILIDTKAQLKDVEYIVGPHKKEK